MTSGTGTYLTPTLGVLTWTWSQFYTPPILGTVYVVVSNNQTKTVTSTNSAAVASHTDVLVNGTLQLLTRTDVNEDGTVTAPILNYGGRGTSLILTYPSAHYDVVPSITWEAPSTDTYSGGSPPCCGKTRVSSPIPSHYPFTIPSFTVNSADPTGWLYELAVDAEYLTDASAINSILAPATVISLYSTCTLSCSRISSVEAASGVQAVSEGLLLTTTVSISDSASATATSSTTPISTSASPAAGLPSTSATSSVEVDPVTGIKPTGSTRSTGKLASTEAPSGVGKVSDLFSTTLSSQAQTTPEGATVSVPPAQSQIVTTDSRTSVAQTEQKPTAEISATQSTPSAGSGTTEVAPSAVQPVSSSIVDVETSAGQSVQPATSSTVNIGSAIISLIGQQTTVTVSSGQAKTLSTSQTAQASFSFDPITSSTIVQQGSPTTTNVQPVPVTIGSSTLVPQPVQITTSGTTVPAVVIGSQTITQGQTASMGTTPVAVVTSGSQTFVVVGSSTQEIVTKAPSPTPSTPAIVVGSSIVTANSASQFIVTGQTLAPGSLITIGTGSSTTVIALQTTGSQMAIVIAGSTTLVVNVPAPTTSAAAPAIIVGSSTISADSASNFIVGGQTLAPGSSITLGTSSSTTVVALQTTGSQTLLVVGSVTSTLATPTVSDTAPVIVVGGSTIIANSASEFVVAGQTLAPGSSITLGTDSSTTVVALQTSDSRTLLVVGTSTSTLSPVSRPTGLPAPLTIGSSVITVDPSSAYVIGAQTLAPGGSAITVSGTQYSLASGATEIVIEGRTRVLATSSGAGIGSYIWSALGGSPPAATTKATQTSSGDVLLSGPSATQTWSTPGSETSGTASGTPTTQSGAVSVRVEWLWMAIVAAFVAMAIV